ncbi:MAG: sortase [Microgenomates group bacterium]
MLYGYKKATAKNPHPGRKIPIYLKTVPTLISALGLGILGAVAYPVVSYQLKDFKPFSLVNTGLLSPVYYESKASSDREPKVLSDLDYTKASSWFPGDTQNNPFTAPKMDDGNIPEFYSISVPSLGLADVQVSLFDEDLTKHLVQYPQTALPGELGSPVIFGHSTLPQFYNPLKYTTIFSNLPKIKLGSDVFVKYKDAEYTYRVTSIIEVKPSELWVLKQNYNAKTIKLITCVPPGTTLRRLVVEATLIEN